MSATARRRWTELTEINARAWERQTLHRAYLKEPDLSEVDGPTGLSSFRASTLHLPKAEQFGVWRDLHAPVADLVPQASVTGGYGATQSIWDLGSLAFAEVKSPAVAYERTAQHLRTHSLDHWVLSYVISGTLRQEGFGRITISPAHSLRLSSLRGTFHGTVTPLEVMTLVVPRDFCREAAAALDAETNSNLTTGLGGLLADYLMDMQRRLPTLGFEELPGLLAATRAMIVACVSPTSDRLAEAQTPVEATLLERARQMIQHNLLSPTLGADELCRNLGVSRSRLYRLFEPLGGVVHYIRCRRLLDAHAALSDASEGRRIADIAAERGFADAAEFSRAFKREFGYRPRDARIDPAFRPVRRESSATPGHDKRSLTDLMFRLQHQPSR